MFDIGGTELLVIGVVALIVVGPKDLPGMFRTLGRFTAKARGMAREFSKAMEDAADESGVKDVGKDLKNLTSARNLGLDKIKDAATNFENWDPSKGSASKRGPATTALSEERAEAARKIHAATAKKASERIAAEADLTEKSVTKAASAKSSTSKKAVTKKATPTKAPAKKKPVAKKPVAKKPTPKTATKKATPRKLAE